MVLLVISAMEFLPRLWGCAFMKAAHITLANTPAGLGMPSYILILTGTCVSLYLSEVAESKRLQQ